MNRREFLIAAAAVGASTVLTAQQKTSPRPVDVHYHMWAPEFIKITKDNGFPVGPGEPTFWDPKKTPWSLSMAVEHNDKAGIIGMTSVPGSTNFGPKRELWPRLARVSNEYAARMRADYPKLFGIHWIDHALPGHHVDLFARRRHDAVSVRPVHLPQGRAPAASAELQGHRVRVQEVLLRYRAGV